MKKKYIDADKLIAEIERRIAILDKELKPAAEEDFVSSWASTAKNKRVALQSILSLIPSLQQEQPKVNLVAELKHHLATTPKEQLEKEWKELEPWSNIGPTVREFLYGKQPEVDLEIKLTEFISRYAYENGGEYPSAIDIANHFYKLGLNARKEE